MKQVMISNMLPTLVWNVSITPIKAHYTLFQESTSDFLVRLCGIIGGIYAFATIFESIVRNGLCILVPDLSDDVPAGKAPEAKKKLRSVAPGANGPEQMVEMVPQDANPKTDQEPK